MSHVNVQEVLCHPYSSRVYRDSTVTDDGSYVDRDESYVVITVFAMVSWMRGGTVRLRIYVNLLVFECICLFSLLSLLLVI